MPDGPLISVIIPTVGRGTLEKALKSALQQEIGEDHIEVIVVNDSGSVLPGGIEALEDYRVSIMETNRRRQSVARNVGAATAKGRFLLFLDDDDYLVPNALASLLGVLKDQPRLIIAYGGIVYENGAGETLGTLNLGISGNCASQMLAGAFIQFGSACIRAEAFFAVGGINPTVEFAADMELFRRLAMVGDFGNTASIIARVLRGEGWSSAVSFTYEHLRASREFILDQKNMRLIHQIDSPLTGWIKGN